MIYGIGRNYAAHAKELGNAVPKGEPIVFFKPDGAIVLSGKVKLPDFSNDVQFEGEMAFKFGQDLQPSEVCIANDLTARDKQRDAQQNKSPWGSAKGFKDSCGLGNWKSCKGLNLDDLELKVLHNGKLVQHGFTKDMIFNVESLVQFLKSRFPVLPGDIVLTGTPAGVEAVKPGSLVEMELVGISQAQWTYE